MAGSQLENPQEKDGVEERDINWSSGIPLRNMKTGEQILISGFQELLEKLKQNDDNSG